MRTTVDLPDELLRQARLKAAREDTTLTALLADGLRLRLGQAGAPRRPRERPVSPMGGGMHPWIDPSSNESIYDAADGFDAPA